MEGTARDGKEWVGQCFIGIYARRITLVKLCGSSYFSQIFGLVIVESGHSVSIMFGDRTSKHSYLDVLYLFSNG